MALLFFLAALLGLVFPPFAVVVLAMMILGVIAKGVVIDSQEQGVGAGRKIRHRRVTEKPQDVIRRHAMAPRQGKVIDVRCYPILTPLRLSTPAPRSLDRLR